MILFGGRNLTLVIIIIVCDLIAFEAGFVTGTRVTTLEKSRIFPNYEICNRYNGRRIYLDLGEQGVLKATNITVPNLTNKYTKFSKASNGTINIQHQCQLELITCPSCIFTVKIHQMNFTTSCDESKSLLSKDASKCKCFDYLQISEPPYDTNKYMQSFCGQQTKYRSKTRVIVIKYFYNSNRENVFNLSFLSEKNRIETIGSTTHSPTIPTYSISSPFFPNYYPRDLFLEHVLKCDTTVSNDCRIEIVFVDFQVFYSSSMQIIDDNGESLGRYTGSVYRPPILVSSGPSMTLRFMAEGGTGLGYRVKIRFLTEKQVNHTTKRYTHCGGFVESFGGAITMMNMVANDTEPKVFDCIWLIKPPNSYMHLKTHLFLGIDKFNNMAGKSTLVIRQGLTSDSPLLDQFNWLGNSTIPLKNYMTSLASGFYISFNGVFNSDTEFALAYTAFSYMECYVGPEFLCQNHRCIPFYLQCDGFDHCSDGSDEDLTTCTSDNNSNDHHWYTHTPNYFFPKMDHYPDLKTASVVFLASSAGLILLIFLLIIILYRMGRHVREQRELQSQLRTISELLDTSSQTQHIEENDTSQEQPPAYEAPPEYEEANSLSLTGEIRRSNRRNSEKKRKRSRSRSRCSSRNEQNASCYEQNETPTLADLSIPEFFFADSAFPSNIIECAIASKFLRKNSGELPVTHSRRTSQIPLIPESPPPSYSPTDAPISECSTVARLQANFFPLSSTAILIDGNADNITEMEHQNCSPPSIEINDFQTTDPDLGNDLSPIARHADDQEHCIQIINDCPIEDEITTTNQYEPESIPMDWLKISGPYNVCFHLKDCYTENGLRKCVSENMLVPMPPEAELNLNLVRRSKSSSTLFGWN